MKRILSVAAILGILTAGTALALPYNDRASDITPGTITGSEPTLQAILDTYVNTPSATPNFYNAITSQSKAALWTSTEGSSTTFLVSLFTGQANGILGIYSATGQYNLVDRTSSTQSAATFGIENGNLVDAFGRTLVAGFGETFGFFWTDPSESYYAYTEDTKNSVAPQGQTARALAYQLVDGTKVSTQTYTGGRSTKTMAGDDDWIIAFEDHLTGDYDFNDATFLIKDITPVPEPGTMMLLGAGFLGLAIYGKRRKNA